MILTKNRENANIGLYTCSSVGKVPAHHPEDSGLYPRFSQCFFVHPKGFKKVVLEFYVVVDLLLLII